MTLLKDGVYFRGTSLGALSATTGGDTYAMSPCTDDALAYTPSQGYGYYNVLMPTGNTSDISGSFPDYLKGTHTNGSFTYKFRWDFKRPGTYDIRLATGANSASSDATILWDGEAIYVSNPVAYANSTGWSANTFVFANGSIYQVILRKGTGVSAAAGSGPSGTGAYIVDGDLAFRWVATPLAIITDTSTAGGSVVDATGAEITAANWESTNTALTVTVLKGYMTITKGLSYNGNMRCIMRKQVQPTLADVVVTNDLGDAFDGLYANDPEGVLVARLPYVTGSTENITLGSGWDTYLEVFRDPKSAIIYLRTTGTRIPEALAGSRTIPIIQTDADATNGPTRTTNLSATVHSTSGRPVLGVDGQQSGRSWVREQVARNAVTEWPGYEGQSTVGRVSTCNSSASFVTAFNAITPDGVSWYELLCQDGDYSAAMTCSEKNFGTGGLWITKASGHNPKLVGTITSCSHGIDLSYIDAVGVSSGDRIWRSNLPTGSTYFKICIHHCNIGYTFQTGVTDPEASGEAAKFPIVVEAFHGDQVIVRDNIISGVSDIIRVHGVRYTHFYNNVVEYTAQDILAFNPAYYEDQPRGVFADDIIHIISENNTFRKHADVLNWYTNEGVHSDLYQHRTFSPDNLATYAYDYYRVKNPSSTYKRCINDGKIYEATTLGTCEFNGTGPTGTGAVIIDGTTVWQYLYDYTMDAPVYLVSRKQIHVRITILHKLRVGHKVKVSGKRPIVPCYRPV